MRIPVAAICAFATLIAEDVTQQAIAAPIPPPVDEPPKAEGTNATETVHPESVYAIAAPEPSQVEMQIEARPDENHPIATNPATTQIPETELSSTAITEGSNQSLPSSPTNIVPPETIPTRQTSGATAIAPSAVTQAIEIEVETQGMDGIAPPTSLDEDEATAISVLEDFDPNPNLLQTPTQLEEVETQEVVPITLEQALELSRRNNQELQIAALELERTQAVLREAQAANLPILAVNADATAQQIQTNGGSVDAVLGGTLEMNYDLFTSGRRSALIEVAEQQIRSQELQVEIISETIELDVVNAYYGLQEADQQVRITQAALEEAERSLRDATALELAGVGTLFDRLQTEVDVANARQEVTLTLGQQQAARRQLRERLNIAESIGVSAADPVEIAGVWNSSLEESIILAYDRRAELEQQLVQREISQQQRRIALADLGPQVSLFANFDVENSLSQGEGFDDTYQVGARVSLNLFDGGAARARAAQEDANIAIAEIQFSDVRSQIRLEVEEAYLSLRSNFENTLTAAQAVETAAAALGLARLRFQAGIGTQADVSRSQVELTRAEVNRLQTVLGYNRALASLQRAVSPLVATSTDVQPLAQRTSPQ